VPQIVHAQPIQADLLHRRPPDEAVEGTPQQVDAPRSGEYQAIRAGLGEPFKVAIASTATPDSVTIRRLLHHLKARLSGACGRPPAGSGRLPQGASPKPRARWSASCWVELPIAPSMLW
jgi:hypothetical protein